MPYDLRDIPLSSSGWQAQMDVCATSSADSGLLRKRKRQITTNRGQRENPKCFKDRYLLGPSSLYILGELILCFDSVFRRLYEVELEAIVDLGVPSVLCLAS